VSTLLLLPPPLRGRVGEGGNARELSVWTPTPNPSPQGGGERTANAVQLCISNGVLRCP